MPYQGQRGTRFPRISRQGWRDLPGAAYQADIGAGKQSSVGSGAGRWRQGRRLHTQAAREATQRRRKMGRRPHTPVARQVFCSKRPSLAAAGSATAQAGSATAEPGAVAGSATAQRPGWLRSTLTYVKPWENSRNAAVGNLFLGLSKPVLGSPLSHSNCRKAKRRSSCLKKRYY
jgi:hypothetical protein